MRDPVRTLVPRHGPLVLAALLLVGLVGVIVLADVRRHGLLVYPLDDTYIHLSMARSAATAGTWGLHPSAFASATSSPLWTALIAAAFLVVGVELHVPWVLATACALGLLVTTDDALRREGIGAGWRAGTLVALVLVTPLPALATSGMEHVLQAWLAVALVTGAMRWLADPDPSRLGLARLAVLAALAAATRLETLFATAGIALLMLWARRPVAAVVLGATAWAPVVAYGVWSRAHGWAFFPNSVLVKARLPHTLAGVPGLVIDSFGAFAGNPTVLLPIVALWLADRVRTDAARRRHGAVATVLTIAASLHLALSSTGWFYRYEAWLVALGVVGVGLAAPGAVASLRAALPTGGYARRRDLFVLSMVATLATTPFSSRALGSFGDALRAPNDRFLEHVVPSRFIGAFHPGEVVVANDIGVLSWMTDVRVLDVVGLASREPLDERRSPDGFTKAELAAWAERSGAHVAVLQTSWREVARLVPDDWEKVGEWEVPRNVVFKDRFVGFFAIDPAEAPALRAQLRRFRGEAPEQILQRELFVTR